MLQGSTTRFGSVNVADERWIGLGVTVANMSVSVYVRMSVSVTVTVVTLDYARHNSR